MNRDDTYKVTREDVWRELELLPAWKLRAPVEAVPATEIENVKVEKLEAAQVASADAEKSTGAAATQYEITISQDKHWAFVCALNLPEGLVDNSQQGMLFNNILHALSIDKPSKIQAKNIVDIQAKTIDIKIIVAMGDGMAQALLNTQDALENLRGKLHASNNSQDSNAHIIATYDVAHLLNYPVDKAKVWQDLCLARAHLQNLQTQD